MKVVVNESDATVANPWPNISGYRLVTSIGGATGNFISIEADKEATTSKKAICLVLTI
jgi:hypothetical protein